MSLGIKTIGLIITVTLSLFILCLAFISFVDVTSNAVYEGKVMFNTEQEYTQFKDIIAQEKVKIIDLKTASSVPSVVDFKVVAPSYLDFPYGENTSNGIIWWFFVVLILGVVLVVLGIVTLTEKQT